MKIILHATVFSVLSMAIVGAWLSQQNIEAPYSLTIALAIPGIVGAVVGLIIALVSKYRRWLGVCLAVIYLMAPFALYMKYYITDEIIGGCRKKVVRAYNKAPNTEILTTWCVDQHLLERVLESAQNKNHRKSFDWIIEQGVSHPNPDCARLGMSLSSYDHEEAARLLAKGISPNCTTYNQWATPLAKLFLASKPDLLREPKMLALLLGAGVQITQDHLLMAIRSRNYYLLSEALKSIDPNFGFDHLSDKRLASQIRNPLALAIHKNDLEALRILIKAGADTSRKVAVSFNNGSSVDTYSLYTYAKKLRKNLYGGAQQNHNPIMALLAPTDPFVAEAKRQRERQIIEQKKLFQKKLRERKAREAKRKRESYEHNLREYAATKLVLTILNGKERQLLFETKPTSIKKIKLFGGRLGGFERKRIEYYIYSEPSKESRVLFSKFKNSRDVLNANGSLQCTFETPVGKQGSCYDFLEARHGRFDDIYYFKSYNDTFKDPNTRESWVLLDMFNKRGWTSFPYTYSSNDPFLGRTHKQVSSALMYHPAKIVQAKQKLVMYKDLDKIEAFERFDRQKYRLIIKDPTIHWRADKAYISAGLAPLLSREAYCRDQSKNPEIIDTIFLELLNKDGTFNIGKLDLHEGFCS